MADLPETIHSPYWEHWIHAAMVAEGQAQQARNNRPSPRSR